MDEFKYPGVNPPKQGTMHKTGENGSAGRVMWVGTRVSMGQLDAQKVRGARLRWFGGTVQRMF